MCMPTDFKTLAVMPWASGRSCEHAGRPTPPGIRLAQPVIVKDRQLDANTISGLVDYFGGYEILARILNVKVADLRLWAEGKARAPAEAICRLIDVKDT